MPPLNLTNYEVPAEGFEPLPRGLYFANIFSIEERETSGQGKLPEGTPMIWLHFQITGRVGEDAGPNEDSPVYNRRAFTNLVVPPDDYSNPKAVRMMNGRLVSFFRAVGFSDEDLTSGTFEYGDIDDLESRELVIALGKRKVDRGTPDERFEQTVDGYRRLEDVPAPAEGTAAAGGLL